MATELGEVRLELLLDGARFSDWRGLDVLIKEVFESLPS